MKYSLTLPQATFEEGFAVTPGWVVTYPVNPETLEYLGEPTMEYLMVGVGLAAFSYLDAPELIDGFAIIRQGDQWAYVEDHRGEIYWIKSTKERVEINMLGALSDEFTSIEPAVNQKWSENGWVLDLDYVKSELQEAKSRIQDEVFIETKGLRTNVAMGIASDEDKKTLQECADYLQAVNAVTVKNGTYVLPETPAYLRGVNEVHD